jgi:hypothetical protein
VSSHAEAVLRGRLSRRHQEKICIEQSRFQVSLRLKEEEEAAAAAEAEMRRNANNGKDNDGGGSGSSDIDKDSKRTGLWKSVKDLRHVMR